MDYHHAGTFLLSIKPVLLAINSQLLTLLVLVFLLLLFLSFVVSGAEVAFFSITHSEKEQLKKSEARGAKIAEKLQEKPKDLLATILIGKNFLNVAFVLLSAIELTKLFLLLQFNEIVVQVLNIVIITLFLLFVGESFPKTVAFKNKAAYARFMAYSIYFFQILPPFSWLRIPLAKSSGVICLLCSGASLSVCSQY